MLKLFGKVWWINLARLECMDGLGIAKDVSLVAIVRVFCRFDSFFSCGL